MKKTQVEELETQAAESTLTLTDVAVLLTVLDEKLHMQSYYEQIGETDVKQFTNTIRKIQIVIAEQIEVTRRVEFYEKNPHLYHISADIELLESEKSHNRP